jgi:hypothetical protein
VGDAFDPILGTRRGHGSGKPQPREPTPVELARVAVGELNATWGPRTGDERHTFAHFGLSPFMSDRGFRLDDGFFTSLYSGEAQEVGEWKELFLAGHDEPLGALHIRYDLGDQQEFVELWLRDRG